MATTMLILLLVLLAIIIFPLIANRKQRHHNKTSDIDAMAGDEGQDDAHSGFHSRKV